MSDCTVVVGDGEGIGTELDAERALGDRVSTSHGWYTLVVILTTSASVQIKSVEFG